MDPLLMIALTVIITFAVLVRIAVALGSSPQEKEENGDWF